MKVEHRKYTKGYYHDGKFVQEYRQNVILPSRSFKHLAKNESVEIYSQFEEVLDIGNEKLRMVSAGEFYSDYTLYGKINEALSDEEYKYFLENSDIEKQSALMQMGGWAITSSNAVSHCLVSKPFEPVPEGMYLPTADDLRISFKYFDLIKSDGEKYIPMRMKGKGLMLAEINDIIEKLKAYASSHSLNNFDIYNFVDTQYNGHVNFEDYESFTAFLDLIKEAKIFENSLLESGKQPQ